MLTTSSGLQLPPRKVPSLTASTMPLNKLQSLAPLSIDRERIRLPMETLENTRPVKFATLKRTELSVGRFQLPSLNKHDEQRSSQPHLHNRPPARLPKLEYSIDEPKQYPKRRNSSHDEFQEEIHQILSPKVKKKHSVIRQWAMKTKAGCQANKNTKTNQDSAITNTHKGIQALGYSFWAICDGHGVNGHTVSGMIKTQLPKNLCKILKDDEPEPSLTKAFAITNKEIWCAELDTNLSGSTTVALLIKDNKIWSANVGDSRAIMCRHSESGWRAIELSNDHKPSEEREKQRIIGLGGRIEAQKDFHGNPIGPERVWLSYIDAPGLAMTRSMGDKVGAQAGVIAEPELIDFTITSEDKFIVIASDGVWEYLSNEDVMNIVLPYTERDNVDMAAERLITESTNAWRKNSLARDDITCIVLLLNE